MNQADSTTSIRAGRPSDAATIVEFQLHMAAETEHLQLDGTVVAKGVQAVFDDPAKGQYWLAEVDGQVAACLLTVPEWSDWRNGTVLWIHSLYVRRRFRRRGVFQSLYRHLRQMVEQDESLKGLRLYVSKDNVIATQTYEAMGMSGRRYQTYEWLL